MEFGLERPMPEFAGAPRKAAILTLVSGQALRPAALESTHEARCNCSKEEPMRTSMYPVTAVLFVAAVFGTDIGAQPKPSELRQQMVGTWTLSEQWVEQDGKKNPALWHRSEGDCDL